MSVVAELIKIESNGNLSFGNYELGEKKKIEDFECAGNFYKVKTFKEMTKLERDGMFVYESVPGTAVFDFEATETGVAFDVCATEDVQITVGLKEDTEYEVTVLDKSIGRMKTNLGGKLNLSIEMNESGCVPVEIKEA